MFSISDYIREKINRASAHRREERERESIPSRFTNYNRQIYNNCTDSSGPEREAAVEKIVT